MEEKKLLRMVNIHKRFPGVYALKNINFDLEAGEVHALLGENGAGKSTLMKILNGIYTIDEGQIFVEGEELKDNSIKKARAMGISIIHQELVMEPHMMIYENIFLGRELTKGPLHSLDKAAMIERTRELLAQFEMNLTPQMLVKDLNVAQQQMIEIIKAVSFNSRIIVMDEPTSSLTDNEVEFLFKTIRELKTQNVGIVYISHRMNEIFEISDRVTVMRDGEYIGTVKTKETTNDELISMMVGRPLVNYYSRDFHETDKVILEVKNLNKKKELHDISFTLKAGEILGFAGLVGSGRSEVMKCIFGVDPYSSGEIIIEGQSVQVKSPDDAIEHRMVYVPEDRKEEGLFLIETVRYNSTLKSLNEFMKLFRVDRKKEEEMTEEYIRYLNIKTPTQMQIMHNLSGGNQQKVLIARWLMTKPKILILDEPTRGIDVGAKSEIYSIMNNLAKEGVGIIMISSELPEVINMSDRICVMANGRIMATLDRKNFTQERIMHYATGGDQ